MKIIIRSDHVHIEGYVNAVERLSKPITERLGTFRERTTRFTALCRFRCNSRRLPPNSW